MPRAPGPAVPCICWALVLGFAGSCGPTRVFPIRALDASLNGDSSVVEASTDVADAAPDVTPFDVNTSDTVGRDVPVITTCPAATLLGYATSGPIPTTGGEGGITVTVTTAADLIYYAGQTAKMTIQISGTIALTDFVRVKSDKTIQGVGPSDGLVGGGFSLKDSQNIIVRKLTIAKVPSAAGDAITLDNTKGVWIDHCDLSSSLEEPEGTYDGLIDVTHGSDWVTASWNKLHHHYLATLVGGSTITGSEDSGHLTVTYHHNWFLSTAEYNPRVRFGSVHVFNNLIESDPAHKGTAIASQMGAQVLIEGNVFKAVLQPIATVYQDPVDGTVWFPTPDTNIFIGCGSNNNGMPLALKQWAPPYPYSPDTADMAEGVVTKCAGPAGL